MLTKLFAQNPSSFGARIGTSITTPALKDSAVELYHMSSEILTDFTNFSNTGVHLNLYECHPKRGTIYFPYISVTDGLTETQGHDAAGSFTFSSWPVGTEPTDSVEFKDLWHIDYTHRAWLGPGDTHRHRTLHAPHKKIKVSQLVAGEDGSVLEHVQGHTRFLMWTAVGAPAKIAAGLTTAPLVVGAGTENHYVTTSAPSIGVMTTKKFKYSMTEFSPGGDIDVRGSLWVTGVALTTREGDGDEVATDT